MTKFEYLTRGNDRLDGVTRQELNALGEKGWELVSVLTKENSFGEQRFFYFFKRPLIQD